MTHFEMNGCLLVTNLRWAKMSLLLSSGENLDSIVHLVFNKDLVGVLKRA